MIDNTCKDYNIYKILGNPIGITNLHEKADGEYENLPLSRVLLDFDFILFAEFAAEITNMYNDLDKKSDRIDFYIDDGTLCRWDLFFDDFHISLYRKGFENDNYDFTSNYTYTEFDNNRCFWIDLYYSKEEFDFDKVFKDILREMNNFKNRDFEKYLKEV